MRIIEKIEIVHLAVDNLGNISSPVYAPDRMSYQEFNVLNCGITHTCTEKLRLCAKLLRYKAR